MSILKNQCEIKKLILKFMWKNVDIKIGIRNLKRKNKTNELFYLISRYTLYQDHMMQALTL